MDVTPRRRAISTILAVLFAVESVSAVSAAAQVNLARRDGAARSTTAGLAMRIRPDPAGAAVPGAGVPDFRLAQLPAVAGQDAAALEPRRPVANVVPAKAHEAEPAPKAPKEHKARPPASPAGFRGRNHVWIPSLRINRSVSWFPCDRTREPDNRVYRWGCAGANNVYLLGHAFSVFEPLHDAYVNHRLRKGMKAYFADARGRVHAYAVKWWKLTLPTPDAAWAWAVQSRPSMTLQTCVGKNSKYRLIVRLVEVGG